MNVLRTIKLGPRLLLAFGAVCLACLVVALGGLPAVGGVSDDGDRLVDATRAQDAVGDLTHTVDVAARDIVRMLYVYDGDRAKEAELADRLAARTEEADEAAAEASRLVPAVAAKARTADEAADELEGAIAEAAERSLAETAAGVEDRSGSRDFYLNTVVPAADKADEAAAELGAAIDRESARIADQAHATAASARRTVLVITALALLGGIALALAITRSVVAPARLAIARLATLRDRHVAGLAHGLERMADGDLTFEVEADAERIDDASRDELGQVGASVDAISDSVAAAIASYNTSRDGLREIVGAVSESSQTLSSASQEMASTSEEAGRAVSEIAMRCPTSRRAPSARSARSSRSRARPRRSARRPGRRRSRRRPPRRPPSRRAGSPSRASARSRRRPPRCGRSARRPRRSLPRCASWPARASRSAGSSRRSPGSPARRTCWR
jgi:hypothetical protein